MVKKPTEIKRFRMVPRSDTEQVLVQRCRATAPNSDSETSRPREDDITIREHARRIDICSCPFTAVGLTGSELRDFYDRQARFTVFGPELLKGQSIPEFSDLVQGSEDSPFRNLAGPRGFPLAWDLAG